MKDKAKERHDALKAAQGFQEFKRDADEVNYEEKNMFSSLIVNTIAAWSMII